MGFKNGLRLDQWSTDYFLRTMKKPVTIDATTHFILASHKHELKSVQTVCRLDVMHTTRLTTMDFMS